MPPLSPLGRRLRVSEAALRPALLHRPAGRGRGSSSNTVAGAAPAESAGASNLGVLEQYLAKSGDPPSFPVVNSAPTDVDLSAAHVDGGVAAVSVLLLVLLLGLSFDRILGLDRLAAKVLRQWKEGREEGRREETQAARQLLERQFAQGEEEGRDGSDEAG